MSLHLLRLQLLILPAYLVGSGLKLYVVHLLLSAIAILPAYLVGSGLKRDHVRADV